MVKAIKRGEIKLNGKAVDPGTWLEDGMVIERFSDSRIPPKTYLLKLPVIYEDDFMAVINKPAGMVTSGNQFKTLENCLGHTLSATSSPNPLPWPRPVHRLDAQTSGIILVAKTMEAEVVLKQAFKDKEIRKEYHAMVAGKLEHSSGTFDSPIDDKESCTEYELIKGVKSNRDTYVSLIKLMPLTGRTHQIRIHLSSNGTPILGDRLYQNKNILLKQKGLFLCATGISFQHPIEGKRLEFQIELPPKFEKQLEREQQMWDRKEKDRHR